MKVKDLILEMEDNNYSREMLEAILEGYTDKCEKAPNDIFWKGNENG